MMNSKLLFLRHKKRPLAIANGLNYIVVAYLVFQQVSGNNYFLDFCSAFSDRT